MRILVTSTPGLGHIIPLVPLAQAFARQGHDGAVGDRRRCGADDQAAGVTFTAAGLTGVERHTAYRTRYPEWATCNRRNCPHTCSRVCSARSACPRRSTRCCRSLDEWPPDLIVHEVGEFAAPIMAGVLGVPHVTQGFGARLRAERLDAIDAVVGPYWRDCGVEPRPGVAATTTCTSTSIPHRSTLATPMRSTRANRCVRSRSTNREATDCRSGWRGRRTPARVLDVRNGLQRHRRRVRAPRSKRCARSTCAR